MAKAIVMPKAGNSVEECILSKWRIAVGDTIAKGAIIADAETDKTSIEVEATEEGKVLALFAKEGDLVPVLTPICAVGAEGEDASSLAPGGAAPAAKAAPAPAEAPAASAAQQEAPASAPAALPAGVEAVLMPKAGNSVEECILSKWRVKVGDALAKGTIIADAETDKTSIEVESTAEGTVLALLAQEGDLVPVLTNICLVGPAGTDVSSCQKAAPSAPAPAAPASAAAPAAPAPAAPAAPAVAAGEGAPLSPRARRFVAEHPFVMGAIAGSGAQGRIMEKDVMAAYQTSPHLTPAAAAMVAAGAKVPPAGTGPQGEITAEDVENFAKGIAPAAPAPAATAAPSAAVAAAAPALQDEDVVTEKPFSRIRGVIAKRLQESLQTMAQYTLNCEADVTGLLALRKKIKAAGEKLGLANINIGDMVMYAVIKTLQEVPELNGEFADNVVKLHSAVHMGFACDTPKGLLVPVLHHSQKMSLAEMCRQVKSLAKAANAGNLAPDLMNGATFTVSNLGSFGVINFTPVISAPQIAMLGVGKTLLRPVRQADGSIAYRDYMQFSLTMNHMVVDGAPGARFLQTLCANIENFELICIAR